MPNKTAIAGVIATIACIAAVAWTMRAAPSPVAPTPAVAPAVVAVPFKGPRSEDDAKRVLMALPELQAWSSYLEKSSGGTVHGALIQYGPTPLVIKDIRYWQISYVENTPDAAHRWESFLVGVDTPDILIEDDETNTQLTLEQWRATRKPMTRIRAR